jgi:hypothetical protein
MTRPTDCQAVKQMTTCSLLICEAISLKASLKGKALLKRTASPQALELFQVGSPAAQRQADALLWELGCRVRLTSAALLDPPPKQGPADTMPAALRVFDDVLPGATTLVHCLKGLVCAAWTVQKESA